MNKIISLAIITSLIVMAGKLGIAKRPPLTSPPQKTNNKYKDYARLKYGENK